MANRKYGKYVLATELGTRQRTLVHVRLIGKQVRLERIFTMRRHIRVILAQKVGDNLEVMCVARRIHLIYLLDTLVFVVGLVSIVQKDVIVIPTVQLDIGQILRLQENHIGYLEMVQW